mgnify:CR=1 FL=1
MCEKGENNTRWNKHDEYSVYLQNHIHIYNYLIPLSVYIERK